VKLERVEIEVYRIPTDRPEADGTFAWSSTTVVVVRIRAGGLTGLGFTYASSAAATVIHETLEPALRDVPLEDVPRCWRAMVDSVRNIGRGGIAATAISAVDVALWDLRARSLGEPLARVLGAVREAVPIYGSGGFTSYPVEALVGQLAGWVAAGILRVKMKIGVRRGARPDEDVRRILLVREAIGPDAELFIDANGCFHAKRAIRLAREVGPACSYFEEPVSSDHLAELRLVRDSIGQQVAAGEYGWDPWYFQRMLSAGAVDVLQADASRCCGITGFLRAATLAEAAGVAFSAHTSPSIHAHAGCAAPEIAHVEYFHDHVRIESMLFDGVLEPAAGLLRPDPGRPGLGLELRSQDAERYRAA
jgi:L-alanine-DL-glutamate epimerase-like enolase superfamily enzyme